MPDKKITIITPSFNQGSYIEQTIRSVQAQNYPNVEHIIVDGGSTDDTIAILKRYSHLIWISEKDRGQADALNKGLALATGDIIGWINSDDYYESNIFGAVARCFLDAETMWVVGDLSHVYDDSEEVLRCNSPKVTYAQLISDPDIVRQPPAFFRRSFLQRAGGWDPEFFMAMDFDLWTRLARLRPPRMIEQNWAYFRLHRQQKSSLRNLHRQTREICRVLKRESAPPYSVVCLSLAKRWQACKGFLRLFLVNIGALDGIYRNRPLRRPAGMKADKPVKR